MFLIVLKWTLMIMGAVILGRLLVFAIYMIALMILKMIERK